MQPTGAWTTRFPIDLHEHYDLRVGLRLAAPANLTLACLICNLVTVYLTVNHMTV